MFTITMKCGMVYCKYAVGEREKLNFLISLINKELAFFLVQVDHLQNDSSGAVFRIILKDTTAQWILANAGARSLCFWFKGSVLMHCT